MTSDKPTCHATQDGVELFNQLYEDFGQEANISYVQQRIKDTPLELVGAGASRVVMLDEKGTLLNERDACVVKIHRGEMFNQNLNEIANWTKLPPEVTEKFIPITDHDEHSKWLVMPYITGDPTNEQLYQLEKHFLEHGYDAKDIKKENVSISQGEPLMNDYGREFRKVDFEARPLEERLKMKRWGLGLE